MSKGNGTPTVGNDLGGTFTPGGFVPNKPKVYTPPDRAPYKHGAAPEQNTPAIRQARASGEATVVVPKYKGNPGGEQSAQANASTKATQRMLNAHGAHLTVDGVWGPQTESAYQAYLHSVNQYGKQAAKIDATKNPLTAPETRSLIPTKAEIAATGRAMPYKQYKPFFDGQKPATYETIGFQVVPVYHNPWHGPGQDWLTKTAENVALTPYELAKAGTESIVQPVVDAVKGVEPQWMKNQDNPDTAPPNLLRTPMPTALGGDPTAGAGQDYVAPPSWVDVAGAVGKGFVHPATDLFGIAFQGKKATTSGVLSDLANIALMVSPAKLLEVGGTVRAALAAGKTADEVLPQVAEMYKAIDSAPGMTAAQKAASKQQVSDFMNALAHYNGEDPKVFVQNVLKGADFKDVSPTTADFASHAGAVEHVPTETLPQAAGHRETFTAKANAIFQDTVANAGKTKIENILPPGIDTPEKLAGLMKELQLRAIEASDYRAWYEQSGRAILEHTGGNTEDAIKLAALLAAYSPQAEVYSRASEWNNLSRALRAFDQYKETGIVPSDVSISKHLAEAGNDWQTRNAQNIMEGKIDWNGLKTNRFFRNFLEHIDPKAYEAHFGKEQFSTQDLWMARAFKYADDKVGGGNAAGEMTGQYKFMHDVTQAVADSLGWTPAEAQAAIWTSMKAEREGTDLATAGGDFSHGLEHAVARETVKRYFGIPASHARGEYLDVLKKVSAALGRKLPASGKLSQGVRQEAEQALAMWAHQSDSPEARAWAAVVDEVKQAEASKSLQQYFTEGNSILDTIGQAQGHEVLAQADHAAPEAQAAAEAAKTPDGGFTLNSDLSTDTGTHGYVVALAPYEKRIAAGSITGHDIQAYRESVAHVLERDPNLRIGGWHNPEDGNVYLDVSKVVPDKEQALGFAREHGQLSIFDRQAAANGDWERAFPESGLSTNAADAIKNAARATADFRDVQDVKGAATRYAEGGTHVTLFRKADASTVVHEVSHAAEKYMPPALRDAVGGDAEQFARTVEEYFRQQDNVIGRAINDVYDGGHVPGSNLTAEARAHLDAFFRGSNAKDHAFIHDVANILHAHESPVSIHAEHDASPSTKTLWHNGRDTNIGSANRGIGAGDLLHFHAYDEHGNLIGAAHGADLGDHVHLTSVKVLPEHEGQGIGGALVDKFREVAGDRGVTSNFQNEKLGAREMARSEALGRETGFNPQTQETLFQTHPTDSESTGAAKALAEHHGIDMAKVVGTGQDGRVTVGDVENYVFQEMAPADQLESLLQGLRIARGKQEAGYRVERGARFSKVGAARRDTSLSNEEARAIAGEAMSGELPKVTINGKARDMTQETLDQLVAQVRYHPTISDGQYIRITDALNDLVKDGVVPQKSVLQLMHNVWGTTTTTSLVDELTRWQKLGHDLLDILNVPRSVMSSMDVSFGLRQALVAATYDPATWFRAWKQQFALLGKWTEYAGAEQGGEAAYKALMEHIYRSPNYPFYERMKLAITDMEHALGMREEGYQSNLAEKWTGGEHSPIRGSGRAYSGMAIKLRSELADNLLAKIAAKDPTLLEDDKFMEDLGHFINGITGRGKFPAKALEEGSPILSALFFSPRLMASRLQMMNPYNYFWPERWGGPNAFIRQQYMKAGLRTYGTLATILGAIYTFVPGGHKMITFDPRSSDFGKIKLGNNRIDIGGGFMQFFHLFGMLATGQKVSLKTGQVQPLAGGKFGQETRYDAILNFLSNKLSPTTGMVVDKLKDRDPKHIGRTFNLTDELTSHITPLIAQDAWQVFNDPHGTGLNGLAAAIAGYGLESTGVGLQNFSPTQAGAKTLAKLDKWAKETNTPIPPKVEQGMQNLAELKSLSASYQGDPKGAMKQYITFYAKTTGDHSLDKYASVSSDVMAKRVMGAIRARLDNGASRYESVIKARAAAKGIK